MRNPASGPSAIATATARLSSTTGDGTIRASVAVERGDLHPVGLARVARGGVARGDRRLHLVRARLASPQRRLEQRDAFVDAGPVPDRAVLLLERHELAGVVDARRRGGRRAGA